MFELILIIILQMLIATLVGFSLGYFFARRKNNNIKYNNAKHNVKPFWFR